VPIDVQWEEMDWEANVSGPAPSRTLQLVSDDNSLVRGILSDLEDEEFPYLSFIGLDTVTVFHQRHLAQLISELERLAKKDFDTKVADHLELIEQLVFRAYGVEDTHITFRARRQN